jgi:hypothetical protein
VTMGQVMREVEPGEEVDALIIPLTCPRCGRKVTVINVGNPVEGGTALNAIGKCVGLRCRFEFGIHVRLMQVGVVNDDGEIHGNTTAVGHHKLCGEEACQHCIGHRVREHEDRYSPAAKRARELVDV